MPGARITAAGLPEAGKPTTEASVYIYVVVGDDAGTIKFEV